MQPQWKHMIELAFDALSGNQIVAKTAMRNGTRGKLRIVAYHHVSDVVQFESQLRWLKTELTPISVADACGIVEGTVEVQNPIWVTFDDGHPSVLEFGLPVLERLKVPATLFVCPGVLSGEPFWWEVVEESTRLGFETPTVADLKRLHDQDRRQVVAEVLARMPDETRDRLGQQLDESALARWLAAGNTIGNHTWDHPLLDMASEEEQIRQIRLAHEWLTHFLGKPPETFAYPNGSVSPQSRLELKSLGYRIGLLFDHRIARVPAIDPLTVSRLRVNSWATMTRYRSIVAGIHPWARHHSVGGERA